MSSNRPVGTQICVTNLNYQTEAHRLLTYFEQFGKIVHYNFTNPAGTSGCVFIFYTDRTCVDLCLNNRPHRLDGRHLYVKRALPYNSDFPRDHYESSRDLMIVAESSMNNDEFLRELREYFSFYGRLYACKYSHETCFDYILIEFGDYDQVDRILLDRPHSLRGIQLNVTKLTSSNVKILKKKFSENECHDDDSSFLFDSYHDHSNISDEDKQRINQIDLENEIRRLENVLKKTNEEFLQKRKQLEDHYCQQLRQLNEKANKTNHLQQDLEKEYAQLLLDYESLKHDNEILNEDYVLSELENFQITSYYEPILAENKGQVLQLEKTYREKVELFKAHRDSSVLPIIPDED